MLDDGRAFDKDLFEVLFDDEVEKIMKEVGEDNIKNTKFSEAITLFKRLVTQEEFEEFLTLSAYQYI